jgi:hypothetical protein
MPPMNPDCGFIDGVMASVLVSKAVDRCCICGMMVNVFVSKVVDHGFISGGVACFSLKRATVVH